MDKFLLEEFFQKDIQDPNDSLGTLVNHCGSISSLISYLPRFISESELVRDKLPVFIVPVSVYSVNDDSVDMTEVADLFEKLVQHCHVGEVHTFGLEAWLNLWSRNCTCSGELTKACRLSEMRSVVARLLNVCIAQASKGYLAKSKENYLMSLSGQVLSKFWLPEIVQAKHSVSSGWVKTNIDLCRSLLVLATLSSPCDPQSQVLVEVAIRLISAQLEAIAVRCTDWSLKEFEPYFKTTLELFVDFPILLNTIETKISNLDPSVKIEACERSADFELVSSDLALFLLFDAFYVHFSTRRIIPIIFSEEKKSDVINRACLSLMGSECVRAGVAVALALSFTPTSALLEKLIETATSVGDEGFMKISDRKNVFQFVHDSLVSRTDPARSFDICREIVLRSKVDSVVGIFVKILKDVSSKGSESSREIFFSIANSPGLLDSDCPVIDRMDCLKSLLNWARFVLVKSRSLHENSEFESIFESKIHRLSSLIDAELNLAQQTEQKVKNDIAITRLLFIAHLVARVKELLSDRNTQF